MSRAIDRQAKPLAFFVPHFGFGGGQKVSVAVAVELANRGHNVAIAVCDARGPLLEQIPSNIRIVPLQAVSSWRVRADTVKADPKGLGAFLGPIILESELHSSLYYFPDLARYLRQERPYALFSAGIHENAGAFLARKLAGAETTRLLLREDNDLSHGHSLGRGRHRFLLPPLIRRSYADAHAIIAVSRGVAEDLTARTGIRPERIVTIYNPVAPINLAERAAQPVDHPWFAAGQPPVILGASRLSKSKDFPTLVRAFAQVRRRIPARLVILGSAATEAKTAKQRQMLLDLAAKLGVADDISLPGFVLDPFPYMARASVFVLSSRHEGFGNGLAEAMAVGCPLVSTDCPSGPAEILDGGKRGRLVPVGDAAAMAEALLDSLENPPDREVLRKCGRMYSVDHIVDSYEELMFGTARSGSEVREVA